MIRVKNYIASSPIHGMGLFAGEDIKKDQVVTQWHPAAFVRFAPEVLETLPELQKQFVLCHAVQVVNGGKYYLDWDNVRFMNHSQTPNIAYRDVELEGKVRVSGESYALRDIKKGEEITTDYATLYSPDHWAQIQKEIAPGAHV